MKIFENRVKIAKKTWKIVKSIRHEKIENHEKLLKNGEQIVKKLWRSCEKIVKKLWRNCEKIVKK